MSILIIFVRQFADKYIDKKFRNEIKKIITIELKLDLLNIKFVFDFWGIFEHIAIFARPKLNTTI